MLSTWAWIASATSLRPCPTLATEIAPEVPSMYSLPSASHMRIPSARTISGKIWPKDRGSRWLVVMGYLMPPREGIPRRETPRDPHEWALPAPGSSYL